MVPDENVDPVMTVPEVASYLKLADSTIYRLVRAERIPARKVGGVWRFSRQALDNWLATLPAESPGRK